MLPPPLEISTNRQTRTPHKPPAQPCCSPQLQVPHPHSSTLHKLHLTLQCPMTCPGLATHTLAKLCALWLPRASFSSGNLQTPAKPHTPQTTCPAQPQPSRQAPPPLLATAEPAFDLAVPRMSRAGHSHTDRAVCVVIAEWGVLLWKSPQTGKTPPPTNHLPIPAAAPSAGSTTPAAHCIG